MRVPVYPPTGARGRMLGANETPPEWKPAPLFGPAEGGPLTEKSDFELCRDNTRLVPVRDRFEDAWARLGYLCPEGQDQFRSEFQARFHQRAWELFLLTMFDSAGFRMLRPPPSAPDLCVALADGRRCWVEAIAPGHGTDPSLYRHPRPMPPQHSYRLNDNAMLLRYTSAFVAKRGKVEAYRTSRVVQPEDAVILAIYTGEIDCADHYDVWLPMAAKAVFPVGDPQIVVPIQPSNEEVSERWAEKPRVLKYNGKWVETAEFTKSENAPISAILYATDHILGMSWDPGSALSLIHNPLATAPLPRAMLSLRGEMWVAPEGPLMHFGRCAQVGYYSRPPATPT